jgi:hypothetical protein
VYIDNVCCSNPLTTVANYLLDSIPVDLYHVSGNSTGSSASSSSSIVTHSEVMQLSTSPAAAATAARAAAAINLHDASTNSSSDEAVCGLRSCSPVGELKLRAL